MKKCSKCKEVKPLDAFWKNKRLSSGLMSCCKDCKRAEKAARKAKDPERFAQLNREGQRRWYQRKGKRHLQSYNGRLTKRGHRLKRKYGISNDDYFFMRDLQECKCAICGTPEPEIHDDWLVVDHDHKTGAVRGLLCSKCNTSLGGFQDDPAILEAAINYLKC